MKNWLIRLLGGVPAEELKDARDEAASWRRRYDLTREYGAEVGEQLDVARDEIEVLMRERPSLLLARDQLAHWQPTIQNAKLRALDARYREMMAA